MRCPDCSQRNSVAAKKCAACGSALRRKPLPLSFKLIAGSICAVTFVFWLAALSSTINNPEKNLTSSASTLTGKSNSAEQMLGNIKNFDQALHQFLLKYGSLNNNELATKLSTALPKSLYESHIFEILPNLKLIEIDTALNATNYLVLLSNGKIDVLPVIGLDVYDSNSFLPQNGQAENSKKTNENQLLVLLGHTANINGHKPRVKVLQLNSTMQSDNLIDLTDSVVPKIYGEGRAKFSPNQKDIEFSISLFSRGQELNVFSAEQSKTSLPIENELLYEQLIWQNNSYSLRTQSGTSKLYALYTAASSLKNHNKLEHFRKYFSSNAWRNIQQSSISKGEDGFTISLYKSKKSGNTNNIYILKNSSTRAIVELRPLLNMKKESHTNSWYVNSLSIAKVIPPTPSVPTTIAPIDTKTEPTKEQKDQIRKNDIKPIPPIQENEFNKTSDSNLQKNNSSSNHNDKDIAPKQTEQVARFMHDLKASVKLRSGPGKNYESVYEVQPTKHMLILGKENGWYRVKVDDKEGFVYAGLVSNQKNIGYRSTLIRQNCTVKDEEHNTITNLRRGEHLIILTGPSNNRYKILLSDGKTGYVSREAIDRPPTESPPPSVP